MLLKRLKRNTKLTPHTVICSYTNDKHDFVADNGGQLIFLINLKKKTYYIIISCF